MADPHHQLEGFFNRSDCRGGVYLHVGASVGTTMQIQQLFQPQNFPGASVLPVLSSVFGGVGARRCNVCAVGLAPDTRNDARLSEMEKRMRVAGYSVLVLRAAAGTRDGTIRYEGTDVPTLDLSRVVWTVLQRMADGSPAARAAIAAGRHPKLAVKMAMEGAEASVLPYLFQPSGFPICHVSRLMVGRQFSSLVRHVMTTAPLPERCHVNVVDMDLVDETAHPSPAALPSCTSQPTRLASHLRVPSSRTASSSRPHSPKGSSPAPRLRFSSLPQAQPHPISQPAAARDRPVTPEGYEHCGGYGWPGSLGCFDPQNRVGPRFAPNRI